MKKYQGSPCPGSQFVKKNIRGAIKKYQGSYKKNEGEPKKTKTFFLIFCFCRIPIRESLNFELGDKQKTPSARCGGSFKVTGVDVC